MRFQNVFGVFVDFLNSAVSQAKRILFESNKIGCLVLSYSELTTTLIKKETRLRGNRVPKTNYGKSNMAIIKIERSVGLLFRYGLEEIELIFSPL